MHSIVARRLGLNPGWPAGRLAVDMMEETPNEILTADPSTLWVAYGYAPHRGNMREPALPRLSPGATPTSSRSAIT